MQIEIAKEDLPIILEMVEDGQRLQTIILKQNRHLTDPSKRIISANKLITRLERAIDN